MSEKLYVFEVEISDKKNDGVTSIIVAKNVDAALKAAKPISVNFVRDSRKEGSSREIDLNNLTSIRIERGREIDDIVIDQV